MRVMLCLLSDQPIPNLLSVHHFAPDRLVLIESADMQKKKAAEHFLEALQVGGLSYKDKENSEIQVLNLVDDLEAVRQCLRRAYGKYPDAQWIANLTGGTKPMSIAAYEFFKAVGEQLVYINATRPNDILRLDGKGSEKCMHPLAIKEFLAAYGFESTKADNKIAEAEARAQQWWPLARMIAEQVPNRNLLELSPKERSVIRDKGLELNPSHFALNLLPQVKAALQSTFGLDPVENTLAGKVDKHVGKFLTGEWSLRLLSCTSTAATCTKQPSATV